jgi:hypothetical protein
MLLFKLMDQTIMSVVCRWFRPLMQHNICLLPESLRQWSLIGRIYVAKIHTQQTLIHIVLDIFI